VVHFLVRCYMCGREWWIVLDDTREARHRLAQMRPHLRCICGGGKLQVRERQPPVYGDG
jgi:hypothetical protein